MRGRGSGEERAHVLNRLATIYDQVGRHHDALHTFETGLPLLRDEGTPVSVAAMLGNMSKVLRTLGRREEAERALRESLAIAAEIGDLSTQIFGHCNLASRFNVDGEWEKALAETDIAAPLAARHGDEYLIVRVRAYRAAALAGWGRYAEAEPELRAVVEFMRSVNDTDGVTDGLGLIGEVLIGQGRVEEGVAAWLEAVDIHRSRNDPRADVVAARIAALG